MKKLNLIRKARKQEYFFFFSSLRIPIYFGTEFPIQNVLKIHFIIGIENRFFE